MLPIQQKVQATDVKICGDTLRIVTAGLPELKAATAKGKLQELRQDHETFRKRVLVAAGGDKDVNAGLLYPRSMDEVENMLFVAAQFGYGPVAGTMLMAAATVLLREVSLTEPVELLFETATGQQIILAERAPENALCTTWKTTIPRMLVEDGSIEVSGRNVRFSLIDTGMAYIVVHASELDIPIKDHATLSRLAQVMSKAVLAKHSIDAVGLTGLVTEYLIMFVGSISGQENAPEVEVVWASTGGLIAQSAGGTGALAVLQHLNATGYIAPHVWLRTIAPGGAFDCRITEDGAEVKAMPQIQAQLEF